MNNLSSEDGDASERELLVDDIQRIREVLDISAGRSNKLSSDEEEGEDSGEEDEEDDERGENEESSLIGVISKNLHDQNVNYVSPLPSKITSPEQVFENENVRKESSISGGQETLSIPDKNHALVSDSLFQGQSLIENNLSLLQSTGTVSSDEYVLTELQPRNFQPPTCVPSSSQGEYPQNGSWFAELNELNGQNDIDQQEGEDSIFHNGEEEINGASEMYGEIQQCLTLNRDYQLAILDELERIEIALAKNREKQYGLHQMRANKDEGKPEPHTLAKFANPYFKDTSSMGPPDNEDTKVKRQSCHFEGYQTSSKFWNQKERNSLAEGVRMQNLENKLSPLLQRIQKLELKNDSTERELQELEDLKAESFRIKNLPKDKLERDLEAIDWDRVSSTYVQKRSGFQCRLQWCNFGHPDVNRKPWTKEEDKMLIKLAKEPENTWDVIAQKLQTKRTPIHCYERYQRSLNKNLLKSKWTPEDDQQLLQVVQIVGLGNWPRVASFLEGRHGDQCLHRYTQTLQMVKKGKWDEDEDKLLKKAVEKYGPCNWNRLSEMVPGRSGPQCRERWVNALDPNINKGPWTKEDDRKLLQFVEKVGKGNWSQIARAMGDRTDNQCWRRWIVLCKDDFLYYRHNTLRKKRELVANFTGRRQERPSLEPEDLDIPDVPVVRKRKGPVPLPIEESRARRQATRVKFREKKRAEKREANRREAEKRQAEPEQCKETAPNEQQSTAGAEGEAEDDVNDEEDISEESKKSPRVRKPGGNRNRVQQPHHRVLMKNTQLSKRKRVAEKREKRHTESSSDEKQVTVTGSLGPFSLLLQAFSIDIPTVLQAIQTTSTPSSTSTPSLGANGAADAGNSRGEEISLGDHHSQGNPRAPTGTEAEVHNVTCSRQTTTAEPQNYEKELLTNENEPVEGKDGHIDRHEATKSTDAEPAGGSQISDNSSNGAQALASTDRVKAGNESTAQTPTTSQATRRRAPAIPPLPPCLTTLKTYQSLLLLRPHLQRIAAMLNTSPAANTAGMAAYQLSSTAGAAGSQSNQMSPNVTFINENDVQVSLSESCGGVGESSNNIDSAPGKDAVIESHNETCLDEVVATDHVDSRGHVRDTEGRSESGEQLPASAGAVTEGRLSTGHSRVTTEGPQTPAVDNTGSQQIQISKLPSHVINREGQSVSSLRDSDRVQTNTAPAPSPVGNEQIQNSAQKSPTAVAPGIRLKNTSYRNSFEYKMLSSRFSSLFLWPSLLSKIRVKGSSQIGPVFAERHPPPCRGGGDSTDNATTLKRKPAALRQTDAIRRKRPGLAAVRMASSASFSTPGQQMCIVGQGSAIKKETPARQPDDPSVAFAASQLLSLQETIRSLSMPAASTSPCNTRKNKRKATPVKRSPNKTNSTCASKRSKVIEILDSSPSSENDSFSEDDSLETEYLPVKSKYNTAAIGAAMKTRQSSQKTQNLEVSDAKLPSDIQAIPSTSTDQIGNADEIPPTQAVNRGDSTDLSQPLLDGQGGADVRQAQGEKTAGQLSAAAANQDLSKQSQLDKNNSPSCSSKRKICKPDKKRGARWRAMLPNVDSEDSDA